MRDPTDTAALDAEARSDEEKAQRKREQEVEDIKWLMAHAQGRRIMARIFNRTGIRRTPFNTNGSTMAFNAGAQNVGLWLEGEVLDAAPDAYMRLLKEFARDN